MIYDIKNDPSSNPMLHHPSPARLIRPHTRIKKDSARKKTRPQKIKDQAMDKDMDIDMDVDVDEYLALDQDLGPDQLLTLAHAHPNPMLLHPSPACPFLHLNPRKTKNSARKKIKHHTNPTISSWLQFLTRMHKVSLSHQHTHTQTTFQFHIH